VARLERRRARLDGEVTDAAAGADHVALRRLGEELATVQAELADAEERWLAVSEELERR
jgi:hypothetical protein